VLGLATVVAVHELAEVVVIANGIRAGRRTAFASHASHASTATDDEKPAGALLVEECAEECCASTTTVSFGRVGRTESS
jgi:cation-transporting ATPase G